MIQSLAYGIYQLLDILSWIIIIKSVLTWLPDRGGRLYELLSIVTEPIEAPIRTITDRYNTGGIDFTPMLALVLIIILRNILLSAMF